jgi:hypothetical protein
MTLTFQMRSDFWQAKQAECLELEGRREPADKIYFTLDTRVPQKLTGYYKGRKATVGIALVYDVMEAHRKGIPLVVQDEIRMAEDYLRRVLI